MLGNVKEIRKAPAGGTTVKYYNLYGAHEFKDDSIANNVKKAAGEVKKLAKRLSGIEIDWYKFYNNVQDRAPAFRGRAMLSFRLETERPPKYVFTYVPTYQRTFSFFGVGVIKDNHSRYSYAMTLAISLYLCSGGVLSHVEWCIRKP